MFEEQVFEQYLQSARLDPQTGSPRNTLPVFLFCRSADSSTGVLICSKNPIETTRRVPWVESIMQLHSYLNHNLNPCLSPGMLTAKPWLIEVSAVVIRLPLSVAMCSRGFHP